MRSRPTPVSRRLAWLVMFMSGIVLGAITLWLGLLMLPAAAGIFLIGALMRPRPAALGGLSLGFALGMLGVLVDATARCEKGCVPPSLTWAWIAISTATTVGVVLTILSSRVESQESSS